jgi:hypothetical protein
LAIADPPGELRADRSPLAIPKKLRRMRELVLEFVLPPRRSNRRFRREVKIKMSTYPKKWRETAGKKKAAHRKGPAAKKSASSKHPVAKKKAAERGKATASKKRRSPASQRARASK